MSDKKPLPDVEDIRDKMRWDNYRILRESIESLLSTIPTDKSSAEYALWLMAQGYKVCGSKWHSRKYLCLINGRVVWEDCTPLLVPIANDGEYRVWQEPPQPVDDEELRRKCVAYSKHMLTAPPTYVPECPRFTPDELARLKELP